jgi:hypothetical protein
VRGKGSSTVFEELPLSAVAESALSTQRTASVESAEGTEGIETDADARCGIGLWIEDCPNSHSVMMRG